LQSFNTDTPNLNPFLLVTFADLKKYVYHYWFAFPALVSKPGWELEGNGMEEMDSSVSPAKLQRANQLGYLRDQSTGGKLG
jgi:ubiquitin-like modifier-activating enzyme ATG7